MTSLTSTQCYVSQNRAFQDAYNLLYNSGMIPPAPEQIPALDADLFKNFIVTIIQLVGLIRGLEVLVVRNDATYPHALK
jgi:hypothetical protein